MHGFAFKWKSASKIIREEEITHASGGLGNIFSHCSIPIWAISIKRFLLSYKVDPHVPTEKLVSKILKKIEVGAISPRITNIRFTNISFSRTPTLLANLLLTNTAFYRRCFLLYELIVYCQNVHWKYELSYQHTVNRRTSKYAPTRR